MHFITTSTLGGSKSNVLTGLFAASSASLLAASSASFLATAHLVKPSLCSITLYLELPEFLLHL
jgi:hypothetical protein